MQEKTLTVITYYHLNEKLLHRCIKGLQQQTFTDFEWLLLTHQPVTENISIPYKEIRLPESVGNKSEAYNYILPLIDTPYIAYNDGDDTSLPERFAKQLDYMNHFPAVSVCSGACIVNDDQPGWPVYENHEDIASFMLINNPIVNPAAMLRNTKGVFGKKISYHTAYIRAQDYDFWFQCLRQGLLFHNINEPLISYYVPPEPPANDQQERTAIIIRKHIWDLAGLTISHQFQADFNDFCMVRRMPEDRLIRLMNHLRKKYYKHPFQHGHIIISNYLNTYITNHEMRNNSQLTRLVTILKKGFILRNMSFY